MRFADLEDIDVLVTDDSIDRGRREVLRGGRPGRGPGVTEHRGRPAGTIVTLTANPSFDRTVALPGPLERGAVVRVEAMTSQAGGKGVNISRAAVGAGLATIAVLPALPDDPFVHELERGRHRLPPRATGGRHPGQPHAHRARRHHHQAQRTRSAGRRRAPRRPGRDPGGQRRAAARGRCWRARCPPMRPAAFYADLVGRLHGVSRVAVDTSEGPLAALVDRLPASAPDLLSPTPRSSPRSPAPTPTSSRPTPAWPRRRPARWSTAASAPCSRRSAAAAPSSSTPTARGTPPLPRPRW